METKPKIDLISLPVERAGNFLYALCQPDGEEQEMNAFSASVQNDNRYCTRLSEADIEVVSRLLAASWNSYQRNCLHPLEAAEGDLLGEALRLLREVVKQYENVRAAENYPTTESRTTKEAKEFLAQTKLSAP